MHRFPTLTTISISRRRRSHRSPREILTHTYDAAEVEELGKPAIVLGELTRRIERFGVSFWRSTTGGLLVGNRIGHSGPAGDRSRTGRGLGGADQGEGGSGLVPQRELRVLEPPSASPTTGRLQILMEKVCSDQARPCGSHWVPWPGVYRPRRLGSPILPQRELRVLDHPAPPPYRGRGHTDSAPRTSVLDSFIPWAHRETDPTEPP